MRIEVGTRLKGLSGGERANTNALTGITKQIAEKETPELGNRGIQIGIRHG